MNRDSVRIVPNIPPIGLRAVEKICIVCQADLESDPVRFPLRLQFSGKGRHSAPLIVGYACGDCHGARRHEVRAAQFVAAQRYVHLRTA